MSRQIFIALLVAAILMISTQSLVMRTGQSSHWHKLETTAGKNLAHRLSHSLAVPSSVLKQLTNFVKTDKDLYQNIVDDKRLTKDQGIKIKNFLIANKEFQDFSISVLVAHAEKADCMKKITPQLKTKLLSMIMEDWDFTSLFLEKKEDLTDPQVHDIVVKLEKDKAIKAELDRCYSTFE